VRAESFESAIGQGFPPATTSELQLTVAPDTIDVVAMMTSAPEVPTFMSATNVPPDVVRRAHAAVPVATAVPDVIAFAVTTPDDAAGANVALHVNVTNSVVTVPPVAGRVPE
jgi:hypothetical protein